MFVTRTISTHKGKTGIKKYEKWWIMRSYRSKDQKHPKHEYLLDITDLQDVQRENLRKVLKNPESAIIMEDDLKNMFDEGKDYGQIAFFLRSMKKLDITYILSKNLSKRNLPLIAAVLLNRLLKPSSKMAAIQWIKTTAFPYFSSLESKYYYHNYVYEAMDETYKNMENIMNEFYHLSTSKPKFFLYDITSVYFDGNKVKIATNGYSRDMRPDRPQVLLGLVLNEFGLPVHFEVMKGNLKDSSTVKQTIKKIKKRFDIKKGIFIGDRGMIDANNIEAITKEKFGYILALKHREAKDLLEKKEIQTEIFEKRIPATIFVDGKSKKYVLCGSEYRKKSDLNSFNKIIQKGRAALEKVQKMVEKNKIKKYDVVIRRAQKHLTKSGAEKYFDFKYENTKFEIIEKKDEIKKAENLCGFYILETSEIEMDDKDVEVHYKQLQQVERIFRDLKRYLDIRPVFHWKDKRVKTHMFLCLLAQAMLGYTRKCLKQNGWIKGKNTLQKFITEISSIKIGKFVILGKEVFQVQNKNPVKELLKKAFDIGVVKK